MAAIQSVVQRHAIEVEGAYQQMLLGLQGAWLAFTNSMGNPLAARYQLHQQLASTVRANVPLLRQRVRDAIIAAHHQGEVDSQAQYLTSPDAGLLEEAQTNIEAAATRDARGLGLLAAQTLQRYQLAVRRMPAVMARQAALGELPNQGRDVFVQLDRLQRKRNSAEFVSTQLRMTAFAAYFHSFASTLVAANVDTFEALHPEEGTRAMSLLQGWPEWLALNTHPHTRWSLQRSAT